MEAHSVFSSSITREQKSLNNNLHDLVNIVPAEPVERASCESFWHFEPQFGKNYIPKKRHKLKVKTIGDIRSQFEKDIYVDLPNQLKIQKNILLRKIREGSSKNESTRTLAKSMLKNNTPISKSAWQMLMQLNPEGHTYISQHVLCNGKKIQINGSKGGATNLLCNYDLGNKKLVGSKRRLSLAKKKQVMLQNSLSVKFKPGPLTKKKDLDISHQKYSIGYIELIELPNVGLQIDPTFDVVLDPTVTNFLNKCRDIDGKISETWAEFAVSVLGTLKDAKAIQINKRSDVTFRLDYNYNQRRILMRREFPNCFFQSDDLLLCDTAVNPSIANGEILPEVKHIMEEVLDSIEITLNQDNMYTGVQESQDLCITDSNSTLVTDSNFITQKTKKKYSELEKLDVTVIDLDDESQSDTVRKCSKPYCSFGCVCASLNFKHRFKGHCGRIQCMFECKCGNSNYEAYNLLKEEQCSEFISGLINLDKEKTIKLSKEEKKFHQTVILTGEKSILLKAQKRNSVVSKKYADFYSGLGLKKENKENEVMTIHLLKLDCNNVEPWCMTHNLYKCFCKGRFVKKPDCDFSNEENVLVHRKSFEIPADQEEKVSFTGPNCVTSKIHLTSESSEYSDLLPMYDYNTCARIRPYAGRKYSDDYYYHTNKKIFEMEKNDLRLHDRMMKCVNTYSKKFVNKTSIDKINKQVEKLEKEKNDDQSQEKIIKCVNTYSKKMKKTSTDKLNKEMENYDADLDENDIPIHVVKNPHKSSNSNQSQITLLQRETELTSWLETSYQEYKKRFAHNPKLSLDPPTIGKLALYPWEFIARRYKQKKNLFLISQQPRHRIFMAVDSKHTFFANCININEISCNELKKYPIIVKNLLARRTGDLRGHFCILRGLVNCWELIGSVSKLNDREEDVKNPKDVLNTEANKYCVIPVSSIDKDLFQPPNNVDISKSITSVQLPVTSNNNDLSAGPFHGSARDSLELSDSKLNRPMTGTCDTQDLPVLPGSLDANIVTHASSANDNTIKSYGNDEINEPVCLSDKDKSFFISANESSSTIAESADKIITPKNVTEIVSQTTVETQPESSKWFFMIVRNDFSEIKFYNKGFFVKLDSVVQAIYVARKTGKTVRLSSKSCVSDGSEPQFGVYALPTTKFCSVFIGPYEKHESLGIESVKTLSDSGKQNKTVGCWFTTKKVDNMKVIENPYYFMQRMNTEMTILDRIAHLKSAVDDKLMDVSKEPEKESADLTKEQSLQESEIAPKLPKVVKPIKIKKTSEFYHLVPTSFLGKVTAPLSEKTVKPIKPILLNKYANVNIPSVCTPTILKNAVNQKHDINSLPSATKKNENGSGPLTKKPVAQIAPQPKLPNLSPKIISASTKQSMFILKPEEINNRVNSDIAIPVRIDSTANKLHTLARMPDKQMEKDIEKFLATSKVCPAPNDDILIISDDEENNSSTKNKWKTVCIQCKNVENLGWIKGKISENKRLSFEFPGFKFTDFYSEKEAFCKINQVLSRKVYVPKHIVPKWEIVENAENLKTKHLLTKKDLGPTYVMTKTGLRRKEDLTPTEFSALMKSVQANNDELRVLCQLNDVEQNIGVSDRIEETSNSNSTVTISNNEKLLHVEKEKTGVSDIELANASLCSEESSDYFPSSDEELFRGYETICVEPTNTVSTCDQSEQDARPPCTIAATYSLSKETAVSEENLEPRKDIASTSFKEHSQILEDMGSFLLNKTVTKKNEILHRLNSVTKDQRQEMADKLQNMMADNVP